MAAKRTREDNESTPAAVEASAPAAAPSGTSRPRRIVVEVGKKPAIHPITGRALEPGEHVDLQANWADQFVRSGSGHYLRRADTPLVRSGVVKLDAPKG